VAEGVAAVWEVDVLGAISVAVEVLFEVPFEGGMVDECEALFFVAALPVLKIGIIFFAEEFVELVGSGNVIGDGTEFEVWFVVRFAAEFSFDRFCGLLFGTLGIRKPLDYALDEICLKLHKRLGDPLPAVVRDVCNRRKLLCLRIS